MLAPWCLNCKFVITPALESKAIINYPDDPEPHVKFAKLKGMGVTSILTAITLLLVSFLLFGCIPVPMMIFRSFFLVIFGYGALLIKSQEYPIITLVNTLPEKHHVF